MKRCLANIIHKYCFKNVDTTGPVTIKYNETNLKVLLWRW